MTAVESLIAERWDTQKLLSAISQQSSLQHVATWAEFQKETRDKLAQIVQVGQLVIVLPACPSLALRCH